MHRVSVTEVLSGNTLAVWPPWNFAGAQGTLVRVNGLSAPKADSPRSLEARCKLLFLICGCDVVIRQAYGIVDGALVADVSYLGKHLAQHLPMYAEKKATELPADDIARPTAAGTFASAEAEN